MVRELPTEIQRLLRSYSMGRPQALILAHQILERLLAYPRKGSRIRREFYRRDLNWLAEVLLDVESHEPDDVLRPTGT